eukprot:TRINITY_DN3558_c0_g1_i1.p1 TRINITY_DN3558_c0_g1~~TRINITY_DN3558_c0_g1_i1.p1  ORF type:complete len:420 (-),score=158.92 TRINITY_DN3558_c0_g1_i1:68-1234(-)
MTEYDKPPKPDCGGSYSGFDHLLFHVSNAKQSAEWYTARMGFEPYAYAGLETGSREQTTWVVKQNDIVLAFRSSLMPGSESAKQIASELELHGDAVKDVAFSVDNARAMFDEAVKRGAKVVREPYELKASGDEKGSVVMATIQTYGNCTHTFVQRNGFTGAFLPGYKALDSTADAMTLFTPSPDCKFIDHVVGNQDDDQMTPIVEWYEKVLQFHRFWSVDDKMVHTEFSSLRSIVMVDYDRKVKMPINEPAEGKKKSQIKEFVEYHGGAGVQHIALNTPDVINAVVQLRKRGVEFLTIPKTYYKNLRERLEKSPVSIKEDMDKIEALNILVDFDDNGYLLQIFTKPVTAKPTLFFEVIQRANHEGFGAGNFKALFQSLEGEQARRGNL